MSGEDGAAVLAALQALEADGDDLRRLEEPLDTFNIFEALGDTRAELRHSHFLGFLLDADKPHGLGDAFLRRLLGQVLGTLDHNKQQGVSIDFGERQRGPWQVKCEFSFGDAVWGRGRIDLLLLNPSARVAVIIENKVDARERPVQLRAYYKEVRRGRPTWMVVGLYLTPLGLRQPLRQKDREAFRPLGYAAIRTAVETLLSETTITLRPDVRTLMRHYSEIVRREIVGEADIGLLCRRLYARHHLALDSVSTYLDKWRGQTRDVLEELVGGDPRFSPEPYESPWISFSVRDWNVAALRQPPSAPYPRALVFDFNDQLHTLDMRLTVQDINDERLMSLFAMARAHQPPFTVSTEPEPWEEPIYHRTVVSPLFYDSASFEEIVHQIQEQWRSFLSDDFPRIDAAVKEWITTRKPLRQKRT